MTRLIPRATIQGRVPEHDMSHVEGLEAAVVPKPEYVNQISSKPTTRATIIFVRLR